MKPSPAGLEKCAVLYIGALVWLPNYLLPYDVGSSMQRFGLSEQHAGWLATGELLALALTALLCSRWIALLDKRRFCVLASLVGAAASAAMLADGGLAITLALKLLFGASMGVLVACAYSLASYYRHPEKLFAQVAITMAPLYGAVMAAVPLVIERVGVTGAERVQLAMLLLGLLLAARMPVARAPATVTAAAMPRGALPAGAGWMLAGVLALFVSQTVALGFAGPAAEARQIAATELGGVFTVAALAQLPAAFLTVWLQDRLGCYRPIAVGLVLLIGVALGMYVVGGALTFYLAASLINAGATIANPYMVAMLASLDDSGRSTTLAGSLTNVGMALGPALAGVAAETAGLPAVGWLASALLAAALVAALLARQRVRGSLPALRPA